MKKAIFSKFWVLALIAIDALVKALALRWIPPMQGTHYPFGGIPVFENFCGISFSLNTVVNTGIAWGVFPHHLSLLLALRLCVVIGLIAYLLFSQKSKHQFALWLIVAGALGNIIDMFFYGHVIDFFHVQIWGWSFPIFNIADSCITCGVIFLLLWPNRSKGQAVDAN